MIYEEPSMDIKLLNRKNIVRTSLIVGGGDGEDFGDDDFVWD